MSGQLIGATHPVAHRRDHRHCDHRLPRQLALPPVVEGGRLRPHRLPRRAGRHRRRRLRAADHSRHHARQHERAADGGDARARTMRSSPRTACASTSGPNSTCGCADHGGGLARRRYARPAHDGAGTLHALLSGKFVSALRSVASEMTMDRDARAARRVRHAREGCGAEALKQNGLELEIGRASPTSTRPTCSTSIRRTASTLKV